MGSACEMWDVSILCECVRCLYGCLHLLSASILWAFMQIGQVIPNMWSNNNKWCYMISLLLSQKVQIFVCVFNRNSHKFRWNSIPCVCVPILNENIWFRIGYVINWRFSCQQIKKKSKSKSKVFDFLEAEQKCISC